MVFLSSQSFIIVSYILSGDNAISIPVRIGLLLCLFFAYEPVCTSKVCTWPKIMGIRVRSKQTLGKISLSSAYIRIVVKILLGFISFLTIPLSKERRAIHDFAAGSVSCRLKVCLTTRSWRYNMDTGLV